MKLFVNVLHGMLFAALPFLVYFALRHFQPREVATALLVLLLLRTPGKTLAVFRSLGARAVLPAAGAMVVLLVAWQSNDPGWVLSYPILMNSLMLGLFATSLRHPPTVIERLARLRHRDLPPEGVAYTRRVTQLWCGFFVANGCVAAWTTFAASRETWLLYNGLISYLLMGILFAGEWLFRRQRFAMEATR